MTAIAGHTIYSRSGRLERGLPVGIISIIYKEQAV
jgi:hypothetical protein